MSDELKERNILKLILIARFACARLDVKHPIFGISGMLKALRSSPFHKSAANDVIFVLDRKLRILSRDSGLLDEVTKCCEFLSHPPTNGAPECRPLDSNPNG
jgi:hypothetical protein